MRTIPNSFALAMLTALAACGKDSTGPDGGCVVSAVAVTGAPTTLTVGTSVTLAATVTSTGCTTVPTVTWSTSQSTTATVVDGVVTGVAAGAVTITATAGGKSGTATFTVANAPVASITMSTVTLVVGAGLTSKLTATPKDGTGTALVGRSVAWTSRAGGIATVSGSGVITGGAEGTTWVIAESETITDSTEVTVVGGRIAFALNDHPTTAGSTTPLALYSYNPTGAANQINRVEAGVYSVGWPGISVPTGAINAQFVTAYSGPNGGFCMELNWSGAALNFRCYDQAGAPSDMASTIVLVGSGTFSGRSAFAWIDAATSSAEASQTWRHHPFGDSISSAHVATGRYVVRFARLQRTGAADREGVIVNAYGSTAAVCQPSAPTSTLTGLEVAVQCFDAAGAAVDTRFTILLVDGARPGAKLAFALADQPTAATYTPTNAAVRGTGTVEIAHVATGVHDVSFFGFSRSGDLRESFLVSPVGTTAGRCRVAGWEFSGAGTAVRVACETTAGVPTDMPFSIIGVQ